MADTRLLLDVTGGAEVVELLVVDADVLDFVVGSAVVEADEVEPTVDPDVVVGVILALLVVGGAVDVDAVVEVAAEAEARVTGCSGISVLALELGDPRPGTVTWARREVVPRAVVVASDDERTDGAD